jgi:hypothetical protein
MLTYDKCIYALGKRETKKLANNTYLRKEDDVFLVKLHNTDIIKVFNDNTFELNTGGWQTVTTKARLKEFTPARISQERGIWYLYSVGYSDRIPFYDGIKIDSSGQPVDAINKTDDIVARKKLLDKKVKKFVDGYIKWALKNGIEPEAGDCFSCRFNDSSLDHVWSHIEEEYYFGSFINTALRGSGRTMFWHHIIANDLKKQNTSSLRDVLNSYFRKVKPKLMEYVQVEEQVTAA